MKNLIVLILIIVVVGLPFLFRQDVNTTRSAEETVVIITPHNEAIRYEMEIAFRQWYLEKTGKTINIDWRTIGGTSEIVRYLQSEYLNSFRIFWENQLGREWTPEVRTSFMSTSPVDPEARKIFLDSDVSVGLDMFFGGGSFEFIRQADAGVLVPWMDADALQKKFPEALFPAKFAGEVLWDEQGRWMGAVLSSFGIIYNKYSMERLGIEEPPSQWSDLADPRLLAEIALADPSKSGSMNKAFEMIVQEQMLDKVNEQMSLGLSAEEAEEVGVPMGWASGMSWIQLIAANARYFTDSATKPPTDVSQGDSAAGMAIDFYGRFQAEIVSMRGGGNRIRYLTPQGASTLSADPIAILRGAPNRKNADYFMEFILSETGQKIWGNQVGTKGGPIKYALRRSPILRTMYEDPNKENLSEPDINPYLDAGDFVYRSDWTGHLFNPMRFVIRVAFIDPHNELRSAWRAILQARERGDHEAAELAFEVFSNLDAINYENVSGPIRSALRSGDKLEEVRLARELADHFRNQYRQARGLASP